MITSNSFNTCSTLFIQTQGLEGAEVQSGDSFDSQSHSRVQKLQLLNIQDHLEEDIHLHVDRHCSYSLVGCLCSF